MMQSASPMLRVSDYQRAKAFWTDVLGFEAVQEAGDPVVGFGIYVRDTSRVFLIAWDGPEAPYSNWRVYFYVTDFDALVAEISAKTELSSPPTLAEYGMKEFEVTDPDGNVLCFGADP